jgi:glyceraldehyde-3-phosphate dehydrogenase/erythrose-4-phosphate dehydrogenase
VLECSGQFVTRESLAPYFAKGVKKVLVSAPVKVGLYKLNQVDPQLERNWFQPSSL